MRAAGVCSNRNVTYLFSILVSALLLLMNASHLCSQNAQADDLKIVLEKIRADKKLLVADTMRLTESEAKNFWPVYDRYQDELFLLRTRTARLVDEYVSLYEKISDGEAKRLINEYITIESLRLKLHKTYLPKFQKVLPAAKVVRYYQLENKVNAALEYELASRVPLAQIEKQ